MPKSRLKCTHTTYQPYSRTYIEQIHKSTEDIPYQIVRCPPGLRIPVLCADASHQQLPRPSSSVIAVSHVPCTKVAMASCKWMESMDGLGIVGFGYARSAVGAGHYYGDTAMMLWFLIILSPALVGRRFLSWALVFHTNDIAVVRKKLIAIIIVIEEQIHAPHFAELHRIDIHGIEGQNRLHPRGIHHGCHEQGDLGAHGVTYDGVRINVRKEVPVS
mmetsp:Transcript_33920/g.82029  ORF Transcript_33920/g.82029 Transcript_33920/m.82029 type:complete len:217 (-) Transcript_33920:459-1109(-)